jgi:glycosyltransferase involved in cell wall biosynthesis
MKSSKPLIVACIPAFNEERMIAKVVVEASKYVGKVVVVNDGSTDMTVEIAERLGAEVIQHEKNIGYGAAIQSLFIKARELDADVAVTLDADGQQDPKEIPILTEPILKGKADIVIGSRFLGETEKKNGIPAYRRLGIGVITKLTDAASNSAISDAQSGFRAYGRKALESLILSENGMGGSVEILMEAKKLDLKIVEVPIGCNYQGLGKTSSNNPLRQGVSVVMSIVRLVVEGKPLVYLGVPGAVSLVTGVFFGIWMLEIYSIEHRIVTNIALASIAFILIGLFAISTSITLYAISRLMHKTNS